jgi:hypothetical protein
MDLQIGETISLTKKAHRHEIFGAYEMNGFQYQNDDDGKLAWHMTAIHYEKDEIKDYWVVGEEFFEIGIHYAFNHTATNLIRTYGLVPFIDPN